MDVEIYGNKMFFLLLITEETTFGEINYSRYKIYKNNRVMIFIYDISDLKNIFLEEKINVLCIDELKRNLNGKMLINDDYLLIKIEYDKPKKLKIIGFYYKSININNKFIIYEDEDDYTNIKEIIFIDSNYLISAIYNLNGKGYLLLVKFVKENVLIKKIDIYIDNYTIAPEIKNIFNNYCVISDGNFIILVDLNNMDIIYNNKNLLKNINTSKNKIIYDIKSIIILSNEMI